MPASWLAYRLTGEYVLDYHSASQCTPLFDTRGAGLVRALGRAHRPRPGAAAAALAGRAGRRDRRGAVAGIPAGVPVITGTIDAWSEAVSVDAQNPGDLMLMYGTTMFLVATVPERVTSELMWGTVGAYEGTRNLAGGMATSGAVTAWLRDLTGGVDYPTLLAEAEASGPGARGLLALPYFAGERTPIFDPDARGVIAGLTLIAHARATSTAPSSRPPPSACGTTSRPCARPAPGSTGSSPSAAAPRARCGRRSSPTSPGCEQVIPTRTIGASYGAAFLAARLVDGRLDRRVEPAGRDPRRPTRPPQRPYDELYRPLPRPLPGHPRRRARPGPDPAVKEHVTMTYTLPAPVARPVAAPRTAYLIASGDLRESANIGELAHAGPAGAHRHRRRSPPTGGTSSAASTSTRPPATASSPASGWAWRCSRGIPPDAPLIVADAVWQYSHHVLAGLRTHRGPILTVANFEPALARPRRPARPQRRPDEDGHRLLDDLDASTAPTLVPGRHPLLARDRDASTTTTRHVRALPTLAASAERELGEALAEQLLDEKAIIGVFDEGCMGMYNAIIDDELLNPIGIYKERLSQSALWAEMQTVSDAEADAVGRVAARGGHDASGSAPTRPPS